jgi:CRP/FNR family transcriptional regulator, cyclic AMP receptor protein
MEDKIWYLKQINILKSLPEKELMELGAQCAMSMYKKGDFVYIHEDEPSIYFIKSGSVKIVELFEDGVEHVKEVIEEGEIFGKFIGTEYEQQEQVIAADDCMVCYLPFTQWQHFIQDNTALSYSFIKWIGLRIKRLERRMDSLYFKSTRQRIDELLHDIIQRFGKTGKDGDIIINLKLTHDELAQLTGSSRQSVNSHLNELRDKGLIEYTRNQIIVKPSFTAHRT